MSKKSTCFWGWRFINAGIDKISRLISNLKKNNKKKSSHLFLSCLKFGIFATISFETALITAAFHTFVTFCLNYCNSLLAGLSASLCPLQLIQNYAARLFLRDLRLRYDFLLLSSPISFYLKNSSFLFKILLLTCKNLYCPSFSCLLLILHCQGPTTATS